VIRKIGEQLLKIRSDTEENRT